MEALLFAVALCAAGGSACRNRSAPLEVSRRFPELFAGAGAGEMGAGGEAVVVSIRNELRPVVAPASTALEEKAVRVERPGFRPFRVPGLDGVQPPVPGVRARIRRAGKEWQPREVAVRGGHWRRTAAVKFREEDVGAAVDVEVATRVPPPSLDLTTREFAVPPGARLEFGFAVSPGRGSKGFVRLAVLRASGGFERAYERRVNLSDKSLRRRWIDVRASLGECEGEHVRLRLQAGVEPLAPQGDQPLARIFVSAPVLVAPARGATAPRNVILVSIDTLRADHIGAYGYPRPITPTIDRLASAGALFENVIAAWPETSASHMTLFTGLSPSVHGVSVTAWGPRALSALQPTLSEQLQRAGFYTGAVTEDGILLAAVGFRRGFDTYREFPPQVKPGRSLAKHPIDGMVVAARAAGEARRVFPAGTQWVKQHRDERFFLFLHTYQVHQRAAPGARYDRLREGFAGDGKKPEIKKANSVLATYAASIAYTDDQLGGLVRALEEMGLLSRTLVVITSDHGEEFFEHGVFGHNQTLYDPALRVPLIFHCPGLVPAGVRVSQPVGLIDVAPTILDLLDIPALRQIQGRSAANLVLGKQVREARGPVVSELADRWRALRTGDSKLIRVLKGGKPRFEFYDLAADPGEHRKLPIKGNPAAARAVEMLRRYDRRSASLRAVLRAARGRRGSGTGAEIDAETRRRMQALGYDVPSPGGG